ncbi:autotransporter domain-containing protein [Candidatus Tisiphia endosymbiont of Nemotelus uliginosus]|uniref:autotransporter domain-containing protein n=1 Tax=Candidatus Tisiphia endosymbiont of Nemotelus uliginosus TaxID=3077926 RepID=UPI0035C90AB4
MTKNNKSRPLKYLVTSSLCVLLASTSAYGVITPIQENTIAKYVLREPEKSAKEIAHQISKNPNDMQQLNYMESERLEQLIKEYHNSCMLNKQNIETAGAVAHAPTTRKTGFLSKTLAKAKSSVTQQTNIAGVPAIGTPLAPGNTAQPQQEKRPQDSPTANTAPKIATASSSGASTSVYEGNPTRDAIIAKHITKNPGSSVEYIAQQIRKDPDSLEQFGIITNRDFQQLVKEYNLSSQQVGNQNVGAAVRGGQASTSGATASDIAKNKQGNSRPAALPPSPPVERKMAQARLDSIPEEQRAPIQLTSSGTAPKPLAASTSAYGVLSTEQENAIKSTREDFPQYDEVGIATAIWTDPEYDSLFHSDKEVLKAVQQYNATKSSSPVRAANAGTSKVNSIEQPTKTAEGSANATLSTKDTAEANTVVRPRVPPLPALGAPKGATAFPEHGHLDSTSADAGTSKMATKEITRVVKEEKPRISPPPTPNGTNGKKNLTPPLIKITDADGKDVSKQESNSPPLSPTLAEVTPNLTKSIDSLTTATRNIDLGASNSTIKKQRSPDSVVNTDTERNKVWFTSHEAAEIMTEKVDQKMEQHLMPIHNEHKELRTVQKKFSDRLTAVEKSIQSFEEQQLAIDEQLVKLRADSSQENGNVQTALNALGRVYKKLAHEIAEIKKQSAELKHAIVLTPQFISEQEELNLANQNTAQHVEELQTLKSEQSAIKQSLVTLEYDLNKVEQECQKELNRIQNQWVSQQSVPVIKVLGVENIGTQTIEENMRSETDTVPKTPIKGILRANSAPSLPNKHIHSPYPKFVSWGEKRDDDTDSYREHHQALTSNAQTAQKNLEVARQALENEEQKKLDELALIILPNKIQEREQEILASSSYQQARQVYKKAQQAVHKAHTALQEFYGNNPSSGSLQAKQKQEPIEAATHSSTAINGIGVISANLASMHAKSKQADADYRLAEADYSNHERNYQQAKAAYNQACTEVKNAKVAFVQGDADQMQLKVALEKQKQTKLLSIQLKSDQDQARTQERSAWQARSQAIKAEQQLQNLDRDLRAQLKGGSSTKIQSVKIVPTRLESAEQDVVHANKRLETAQATSTRTQSPYDTLTALDHLRAAGEIVDLANTQFYNAKREQEAKNALEQAGEQVKVAKLATAQVHDLYSAVTASRLEEAARNAVIFATAQLQNIPIDTVDASIDSKTSNNRRKRVVSLNSDMQVNGAQESNSQPMLTVPTRLEVAIQDLEQAKQQFATLSSNTPSSLQSPHDAQITEKQLETAQRTLQRAEIQLRIASQLQGAKNALEQAKAEEVLVTDLAVATHSLNSRDLLTSRSLDEAHNNVVQAEKVVQKLQKIQDKHDAAVEAQVEKLRAITVVQEDDNMLGHVGRILGEDDQDVLEDPDAPRNRRPRAAPAAPPGRAANQPGAAPAANQQNPTNDQVAAQDQADAQAQATADADSQAKAIADADAKAKAAAQAAADAAAQAKAQIEAAEKEQAQNIVKMHTPVGSNSIKVGVDSIQNRLGSFVEQTLVAAGDEPDSLPKGVWISGVYGNSKQGTTPNNAKYNATHFGPTIGADVNINDNNIVGIAYSYILSNYKFKDNLNRKLNAKSNVISLYSHSQINEDIIWDNILSVSFSKVKVKDLGLNPGTSSQVNGKYNNTAYRLDTKLGYRIPTDDKSFSIIPYIGLGIGHSKDSSYTLGKVAVDAKSESPVAGVIGAQIAKKYRVSETTTITPALDLAIEKNFNNKNKVVKAKFVGTNEYFPTQAYKKSKGLEYNIGASVLVNHKNIDIGVGYNCNLQKKYQAHQGYLKLKVAL